MLGVRPGPSRVLEEDVSTEDLAAARLARVLQRVTEPMTGAVVNRAGVLAGGVGVVEFAPPPVRPEHEDQSSRTRWRFEIYNSAWRLQSVTEVLAGSGDSVDLARAALAGLRGSLLSRIAVRVPALETVLDFGEVELRLFPQYTGPDDSFRYWSLTVPSGETLSVGPGLRISSTLDDRVEP